MTLLYSKCNFPKKSSIYLLQGSGKTAAFVIPALALLATSGSRASEGGIKVLLLAPTRELAEQIHREAERLSAGRRFRLGIVKKSIASSSALEGQVIILLFLNSAIF